MAQAISDTATVVAPTLAGVWLHDPSDSVNTISQFLYGNVGRSEGFSVASVSHRFIGRAAPVYDMGGFESQTLDINIMIPAGPDEQDTADWFRSAVRARKTLCYRDNRGRLTYGIIGSISFKDLREGTEVSFTFDTVDFSEGI